MSLIPQGTSVVIGFSGQFEVSAFVAVSFDTAIDVEINRDQKSMGAFIPEHLNVLRIVFMVEQ
jgi:hypothetical protein